VALSSTASSAPGLTLGLELPMYLSLLDPGTSSSPSYHYHWP